MQSIRQRGDTIIEVIFATTVFSMVAVGSLSLMNQGTAMAQRSLEIGLVRDQMDAQADALRYIHSAYIAGIGQGNAVTEEAWNDVSRNHSGVAARPFSQMLSTTGDRCQLPPPMTAPTLPPGVSSDGQPFAIDIRKLDGRNTKNIGTNSPDPSLLFEAAATSEDVPVNISNSGANLSTTYAQIRYPSMTDLSIAAIAQGIWIQAVHTNGANGAPGYYDFHIRACWFSPGQAVPVTLGTVVRLYDPR